MKQRILLVKDYSNTTTFLVSLDDNKELKDVLHQATEIAKNSGISCDTASIPDECWIQAGAASIEKAEPYTAALYAINPVPTPCEEATCRYCTSFCDGICMKYGGECNPDDTGSDCVHGYEIYELCYNGRAIAYVRLDDTEDVTPAEAAGSIAKAWNTTPQKMADSRNYNEDSWSLLGRDW